MGNLKDRLEKKKKKRKVKKVKAEFLQKDLKPKEDEENETNIHAEKKKKKRKREKKIDVVAAKNVKINNADKMNEKETENKKHKTRKKRRKSGDKNDEEAYQSLSKLDGDADNFNGPSLDAIGSDIRARKSKKSKKKKKNKNDTSNDCETILERKEETDQEEFYHIASGDEDSSKGMKKWLTEYHQSRLGLKVLQQRIDEFIISHEEKLEQERKEREARAADDGWTVVVHHKGRKKTTDSETGITVGSVAKAVVEDQMAKKKRKDVGIDFYRFQRREAQRNEILTLQSKFEQDKKRIRQLRAARKFRPY